MAIIQAILMGFIQGLTEFLPVSSSGHLVLISSLCEVFCKNSHILLSGQQEVFFDIVLHVGSLVAVLIYFKQDIMTIIKEFTQAIKSKDFSAPEAKLPLLLILGTIFTILVAFPLKDFTEKLVSSPSIVGAFIFITGIILFTSEFASKHIKPDQKIDVKKAILIGIAQGFASFPGISRSGSTISMGLLLGLDRVTSARYSFLLSILIIVGTSIFYPVLEFTPAQIISFNWTAIAVGFVVSLIISYFCIKYFLKFLGKHSMQVFAYYCAIMGLSMMVFFHFVK